jgi:hypothetical protein
MSMVLEESLAQEVSQPADRLQATMAAVRVSLRWLGVRKTLTRAQKTQAAESFGAQGDFLSAGKKLLDTRHPAFLAVTAVRHQIGCYWKAVSLPFPEPGIRLIRQELLEDFDSQLKSFQCQLAETVEHLNEVFNDLKLAARGRLGQLYNSADYPVSLTGLFAVEWDYPSVEPPDYLRQLNPELYRQECQRASARFSEAVRLAEEAFTSELAGLVAHLRERITGAADGKPKVFRDSAVENFQEFFTRFRTLNIGSSAELDQLVEQAKAILQGVEPIELRDSSTLRAQVAQDLESVQQTLDLLLEDRPRRNILRRPR